MQWIGTSSINFNHTKLFVRIRQNFFLFSMLKLLTFDFRRYFPRFLRENWIYYKNRKIGDTMSRTYENYQVLKESRFSVDKTTSETSNMSLNRTLKLLREPFWNSHITEANNWINHEITILKGRGTEKKNQTNTFLYQTVLLSC